MKHFFNYLRACLLLVLAAGIGLQTAEAQRQYAERGGRGTTCTNPDDPCSISAAISAASSGDVIAIRVRSVGDRIALAATENVTLTSDLTFAAYVRGKATEDTTGTVVIQGDVALAGNTLTVDDDLNLILESESITVAGGTILGKNVTLARSPTVTLGAGCGTVQNLTVDGSVTVENDAANACTDGLTISNSLTVNSGDELEMDDGLNLIATTTAAEGSEQNLSLAGSFMINGQVMGSGMVVVTQVTGFMGMNEDYNIRDNTHCFGIHGGGSLDMDVMKGVHALILDGDDATSDESPICIDVASVGGGGTSSNAHGTMIFRGTTMLDGAFTNADSARTKFKKAVTITDDVEIVASTATADANSAYRVNLTKSHQCLPQDVVFEDAAVTTTPAEPILPGVHFFAGTTIEGDLVMVDLPTQPGLGTENQGLEDDPATTDVDESTLTQDAAPANCYAGAWFHGTSDSRVNPLSTIKGIFEVSNDVTTATVTADSLGGNIYLGTGKAMNMAGEYIDAVEDDAMDASTLGLQYAYRGSHSLAFESDVFIDGTHTTINYEKAATGGSVSICSGNASSSGGNKVIFSGSAPVQEVRLSTHVEDDATTADVDESDNRTLRLSTVVVDKAMGSVILDRGEAGLEVSHLDILSGTLVTGTQDSGPLLKMVADGDGNASVVVNQNTAMDRGVQAAPKTFTEDHPTYIGGSTVTSVSYAGSVSSMVGDELKGVNPSTVTISKTGTLGLTSRLVVSTLNLYEGTLVLYKVEDNASTDHEERTLEPTTVTVARTGDIGYAEGDMAGNYHVPATLNYRGSGERAAGNIWPAHMDRESATANSVATPDVNIGALCSGRTTVKLNEGWTPLAGNLNIESRSGGRSGALDLAGQSLVINEKNTAGAAGLAVVVYNGSRIFDSAPSGAQERIALADEVSTALELVGKEDTRENRTRLSEALAALDDHREKTSAFKNGIVNAEKTNCRVGNNRNLPCVAPTTIRLNAGATNNAGASIPMLLIDRSGLVVGGVPRRGGVTLIGANPGRATPLSVPYIGITKGQLALDEYLGRVTVGTGMTLNAGTARVVLTAASELRVVGDYMQSSGTTLVNGKMLTVMGDHFQDSADSSGTSTYFSVGSGGTHTVTGNIRVGADMADNARNQYRLDGGSLNAMGDVTYMGSGSGSHGLSGTITFSGDSTQTVYQGSGNRSKFGTVVVNNSGAHGVMMASNVTQNSGGTLTLTRGLVMSGDNYWSLENSQFETDLVGRITAGSGDDDDATVWKGSRNSLITGATKRKVTQGNAGGGLVTGGYMFPTGSATAITDSTYHKNFRPIILQLPDDLGTASTATASAYMMDDMSMMEWPAENVVVEAVGGGSLTLDNFANMFWKVEFDENPAHDPNIRIAADELPNVFDIRGLRIVQWECDGTNPRMAGVYDLQDDPTDDKSMALNDMLNGVPNLTQEGVDVSGCNIFGIASNLLENPISMDPITGGLAKVQFIHNVIGAVVDVYVNDVRLIDDFATHSATGFAVLRAGQSKIQIVAANAPDNSLPLFETTLQLNNTQNYTVIAHGDLTKFDMVVKDNVRLDAMTSGNVEFFLVHGAPNVGQVDIRLLDPTDNNMVVDLLANNVEFSDVGAYISMAPGGYNFEISTANNDAQIDVFRVELAEFGDATLVLNLAGAGKSSAEGLTMVGVDAKGGTFMPSVITAAEDEELPTEFALHGNYPNPFNPSTRIEFDLPESAEVTIQVVDMLGRRVLELQPQEIEAGAKRTIELNASNLASGPYLYRLIAKGLSSTHIETGRFMLVK